MAKVEDCDRIAAEAVAEFGRLDVLVNNAGVGIVVPALGQSPDEFRRVIEINLNGCQWMACAAARAMGKDGGRSSTSPA